MPELPGDFKATSHRDKLVDIDSLTPIQGEDFGADVELFPIR
jgi:hypothetical protein